MKNTTGIAAISVVVLLVAGCATNAARWEHPNLAGTSNAEDAATLAQAQCDSYAAGLTPMPAQPTYMPVPASQSYSSYGTMRTYGNTSYYSGTTMANTSPAAEFASGFNRGAALGAAIAEARARSQAEKVSAACMRQLGWIDTSTESGQEELKKKTEAQQEIDYVAAYDSAVRWNEGTGEDYTYKIGVFRPGENITQNGIGIIRHLVLDEPLGEGSSKTNERIIFDAYDCTSQQVAELGFFDFMDGKPVTSDVLTSAPKFFPPQDDLTKQSIEAYCRALPHFSF